MSSLLTFLKKNKKKTTQKNQKRISIKICVGFVQHQILQQIFKHSPLHFSFQRRSDIFLLLGIWNISSKIK